MVTAIILITAEEDLGLTSIIIKLLNCLDSNLYRSIKFNLLYTVPMIPLALRGPVAQLDRATDF